MCVHVYIHRLGLAQCFVSCKLSVVELNVLATGYVHYSHTDFAKLNSLVDFIWLFFSFYRNVFSEAAIHSGSTLFYQSSI